MAQGWRTLRPLVGTRQVLQNNPVQCCDQHPHLPHAAAGRHWLDGIAPLPEEFVAKENINFEKRDKQASEGVAHTDDNTVPMSNLPPPPKLTPHQDLLCRDALTFDPLSVLEETDEYLVAAPDDQAELMQWHYCLSHASFPKLKQLACNGKILAKLANIRPPHCAGCLFGAMTKVP
jgi:hypothetical protein